MGASDPAPLATGPVYGFGKDAEVRTATTSLVPDQIRSALLPSVTVLTSAAVAALGPLAQSALVEEVRKCPVDMVALIISNAAQANTQVELLTGASASSLGITIGAALPLSSAASTLTGAALGKEWLTSVLKSYERMAASLSAAPSSGAVVAATAGGGSTSALQFPIKGCSASYLTVVAVAMPDATAATLVPPAGFPSQEALQLNAAQCLRGRDVSYALSAPSSLPQISANSATHVVSLSLMCITWAVPPELRPCLSTVAGPTSNPKPAPS